MTNNSAKMNVEIVSHCWQYSRLLTYQLSSLVLFPPSEVKVTMTVFYSREDERTRRVLDYFQDIHPNNVIWNWREQDKPLLTRRAIGRNMAALETTADWIFFADCDQVFRQNCIDSFAQLKSLQDVPLVFPRYVNCCEPVEGESEILNNADEGPAVLDIDVQTFHPKLHTRAIGGVQIACGDVVRCIGYCKDIERFMQPGRNKFGRTKEDVVFRKLIGSQGEPVDIPNMYRIEHQQKGRRWFSRRNEL